MRDERAEIVNLNPGPLQYTVRAYASAIFNRRDAKSQLFVSPHDSRVPRNLFPGPELMLSWIFLSKTPTTKERLGDANTFKSTWKRNYALLILPYSARRGICCIFGSGNLSSWIIVKQRRFIQLCCARIRRDSVRIHKFNKLNANLSRSRSRAKLDFGMSTTASQIAEE